MCEEEAPCEDLINAVSTRQIDEDRSTELPIPSSSHVSIDETQPMHEDDEGQKKDLRSKMASRSSRRGRPKKGEVTQTAEAAVHQTITETQPVPEEVIERDEDLNSAVKSRRSRRVRQIKEDNVPQPAEAAVSSISINTETQPVHEDRTERDEDLSASDPKDPAEEDKKLKVNLHSLLNQTLISVVLKHSPWLRRTPKKNLVSEVAEDRGKTRQRWRRRQLHLVKSKVKLEKGRKEKERGVKHCLRTRKRVKKKKTQGEEPDGQV